MQTLKPLGNKLLVTPYRRETTWGGSILLNETQRKTIMGDDHIFWVVAVGEGVDEVRVKDRVVLTLDHDGVNYLDDGTLRGFVSLSQVLAVLPHEGFQTPA